MTPGSRPAQVAEPIYAVGRDQGSVVAAGPVGGGQPNTATFQIPYASGTLVATGYRGGEVVGTRTLQTTSGAARLRLVEQWRGDAHEGALTFVLVEVLDAEGRLEPEAEVDITLQVEGSADVVAFGSAGPLARGSFTTDACRTWRGRALAVLRSSGVPAEVQVEVHSRGLQSAALVIDLLRRAACGSGNPESSARAFACPRALSEPALRATLRKPLAKSGVRPVDLSVPGDGRSVCTRCLIRRFGVDAPPRVVA